MLEIISIFVAFFVFGYLMGNISFARIISKVKKSDITKLGSGNPGTMNMMRNFGARIGLLTMFLDILKSAIPCFIAFMIAKTYFPFYQHILVYFTGLCVVIGHIFPVAYNFMGGKGIACTLGIFAVLYPLWFAIFLVVGLIVLLSTRIGSLTSFSVVTGLSVVGIVHSTHFVEIILLALIFALLIFAHRSNIVRFFKGQENKVEIFKKKDKK